MSSLTTTCGSAFVGVAIHLADGPPPYHPPRWFVESKDWGAGRGALLGGAIGILGGPLGIIAGGSIGALVAKLRDSGFKNDQLEQLGGSLEPNSSAIVVEIAKRRDRHGEGTARATRGAELRRGDLDENVASLFAQDAEPEAEPEPAATSSESSS